MTFHRSLLTFKRNVVIFFLPKALKRLLNDYHHEDINKIEIILDWLLRHQNALHSFLWKESFKRLLFEFTQISENKLSEYRLSNNDQTVLPLMIKILLTNLNLNTPNNQEWIKNNSQSIDLTQIIFLLSKKTRITQTFLTELCELLEETPTSKFTELLITLGREERFLKNRSRAFFTPRGLQIILNILNENPSSFKKLCHHLLSNSPFIGPEELNLLQWIKTDIISASSIHAYSLQYGHMLDDTKIINIRSIPDEELLTPPRINLFLAMDERQLKTLLTEIQTIQEYAPHPAEVLSEALAFIIESIQKNTFLPRKELFIVIKEHQLCVNSILIPILQMKRSDYIDFSNTLNVLVQHHKKLKWPIVLELINHHAFKLEQIIPILAQKKLLTNNIVISIIRSIHVKEMILKLFEFNPMLVDEQIILSLIKPFVNTYITHVLFENKEELTKDNILNFSKLPKKTAGQHFAYLQQNPKNQHTFFKKIAEDQALNLQISSTSSAHVASIV